MNIRRYSVPKAGVFITQVLEQRTPVFAEDWALELLREMLRDVKKLHSFAMLGYVFLPDHFHLLIHSPRKRSHIPKLCTR